MIGELHKLRRHVCTVQYRCTRGAHLVSDAAGARHHQGVRTPRVEDPVEPPHLPGVRHLLRHEAAALEPGLGEGPDIVLLYRI